MKFPHFTKKKKKSFYHCVLYFFHGPLRLTPKLFKRTLCLCFSKNKLKKDKKTNIVGRLKLLGKCMFVDECQLVLCFIYLNK